MNIIFSDTRDFSHCNFHSEWSVRSAANHNTEAKIYFLTTKPDQFKRLEQWCHIVPIDGYKDELDLVTQHCEKNCGGGNPTWWHVGIFLQWAIYARLIESGIISDGPAFVPDTDMMVFCNIQEHFDHTWKHYDLCACWNCAADFQAPVVFNTGILSDFSRFIVESMKSGSPWMTNTMVCSRKYAEQRSKTLGVINTISNGQTFDQNMGSDEGGLFEMEGDSKRFVLRHVIPIGFIPYCKHVKTGELIRFNWIHFWGPRKELMADVYRNANP